MSSHATLSAATDDRKARLAQLKSLKRKKPDEDTTTSLITPSAGPDGEDAAGPPTNDVARMHLSGRNYDPETRGPKLGFEAPPTLALDKPTLEEQAADLEEESKRQAAIDAQDDKGIDLFKLQPKKPNWDLKRELNQKMEVLNVRTDNAIARMVRERLDAKKASQGPQKIAGQTGGVEDGDGDAGLLEGGAAMVEGMRLREKEEAEEERRERELEETDLAT
ncbi:cwf18 pre-mRNA splicing factor-domain-containing protein [Diplogelasinospora grovesii]|uniref:Cwf18 pre-mRNA splicing factor-domain-containing protein n=1 Tax=Diplogelasinospora grovesii TaxID=303347 RepID=A0AAN6NIW7_9PEZI|nr:cwf18 pre-mRNA splicing factor-domain-containing protein [Diplogelasinospora grovesii]